jgi:hypothetical protein
MLLSFLMGEKIIDSLMTRQLVESCALMRQLFNTKLIGVLIKFKIFFVQSLVLKNIVVTSLIGLLVLVGCDVAVSHDTQQRGKEIQTHMYNYTRSEIMFASYHDASDKFDITTAAPAGSTPFTNTAVKDLGGGVTVHFDGDRCCFPWRYQQHERLSLKVVWLEVYDPTRYRREESRTDDRSIHTTFPGSQWCEMIVKVQKPLPADPGGIVFHFLPDGSVEANVVPAGTEEGYSPYLPIRVRNYGSRSTTPLCRNPITNPWYLIPQKPYRE